MGAAQAVTTKGADPPRGGLEVASHAHRTAVRTKLVAAQSLVRGQQTPVSFLFCRSKMSVAAIQSASETVPSFAGNLGGRRRLLAMEQPYNILLPRYQALQELAKLLRLPAFMKPKGLSPCSQEPKICFITIITFDGNYYLWRSPLCIYSTTTSSP